ncbi:MAG: (E)-4-hydroxy-3-methylbut-2-enyl-diphosphate synthase [Candidatus Krumholzibacteriota bacterium]|nr:(E)-4-hydroxy-3-methylbut-2-enyl-diphosphate synthase [Candidatus Krumholzibacteriota bacterium]
MTQRLLLAREVAVGAARLGGRRPLLCQTMTTSPTEDVDAAYAEVCRLAEAGAALVRLAVPGPPAAAALEALRARLDAAGVAVPLAADCHFHPRAALDAADFVEKLRINPGNFAERRPAPPAPLDDAAYAAELERIAGIFSPLVEKCARLGRALRVGSNHGSLSERILARYGDTPRGMVEAALEYVRMAEARGFHELVISMKASNPRVMVNATRLLALEMLRRAEGEGLPVYPLHLGVTEAGAGEDARLKSYVGMGSLLEAGIGDTVRVSLTENPERELPSALALAERYSDRRLAAAPWTVADLEAHFHVAGADAGTGALAPDEVPAGASPELRAARHSVTLVPVHWQPAIQELVALHWVPAAPDHIRIGGREQPGSVLVPRGAAVRLAEPRLEVGARERTYLELAVGAGVPLLEGRARAVAVLAGSSEEAVRGTALAYALLQATRLRLSRAEFISCPSCGRTHFDLQAVSRRVRERFEHLEGVTIAVMGCIVNGPGEMAGADFGYVGSAPGRVDLYVGRERVARNIPDEEAVDRLQTLLEKYGVWCEPPDSRAS